VRKSACVELEKVGGQKKWVAGHLSRSSQQVTSAERSIKRSMNMGGDLRDYHSLTWWI
jgi:hypothetical protein